MTFLLKGSTLAGKMTEESPIHDPSVPNSVSVPETPRDSFGIEMRYNPEFVYTVLDRSYKSKSMILNNNWKSIYEKGYDLFDGQFSSSRKDASEIIPPFGTIGIWTSINCDLKVKTIPDWPNRSSKVFSISTELLWPSAHSKFEFLAPRLQTELLSMGLDFDLTGNPEGPLPGSKFLISRNLDLLATIKDWGDTKYYQSGSIHTPAIKISLPYPSIDLASSDDIKKSMDVSAYVLEKTIRALYKMYNKRVPLQKLVFEPLESASTEKTNIASCTYCNSYYPIVHGLTCPHCGASNPRFTT